MLEYRRTTKLWVGFADAMGVVGLIVWMTGGFYAFSDRAGSPSIAWQVSQYGLFFIPLALVWWQDHDGSILLGQIKRVQSLLCQSSKRRFWLSITGLFATIALFHISDSLMRYYSFKSDWDLAIYADACAHWLQANFRIGTTLLADHFEPMLIVLSPVCQLGDPAPILLVVQVAIWFVGALGLTSLVERVTGRQDLAGLLGFIYLSFVGNYDSVMYDFHLISLALGVLPWLFWALHEKKFWLFWLLVAVYLGLKENTSLSLVAIGIWLGFSVRGKRPWLVATVGVISFVLIMKVVFPYARDGRETMYFAKYYGHLGADLGSFLRTMVGQPGVFFASFFTWQKGLYLLKVIGPFWILLFRPKMLVLVLPALFINVASNHPFLLSGGFHYQVEIYALIFSGLAYSLSSFFELKGRTFAIWSVSMLVLWSGHGLGGGRMAYAPDQMHVRIHSRVRNYVKDHPNRQIAVVEKVATHMTDHRDFHLLDKWDEADTVILAYPRGKSLWQYSMEHIESRIRPNLVSRYDLYYRDPLYPSFEIWHRRP